MLALLAAAFAAPTDTSFSVDRGFFDGPFTVEITSDDPAATIHYSLDFSDPTTASPVYTGPISITGTSTLRTFATDGVTSTNIDTATYLFLADVPAQAQPVDAPSSWGGIGADYWIDPEILAIPSYGTAFEPALLSLPTVSLVTDSDNLWDASTGLYVNTTAEGVAWERPVSIEWIDDSGPDWQEDAGLRITGGVGRVPNATPKHSFRLLFKEQYGVTKLKQDVFETPGASQSFDTLVLRAGFNYSWPVKLDWERNHAQYLRDTWVGDSQREMGHASPHMRYAHLYLNGLYWGVYKVQERPQASFSSTYYGGDKDEWDVVNSGNVIDGNGDSWAAMHAAAAQDLTIQANYDALLQLVDEVDLIDYILLNFVAGNFDWALHNYYAARRRLPGEGWKFYSWDAERSLHSVDQNSTTTDSINQPSGVHQALTNQPEYVLKFADRIHRHLFNDGVLDCTVGAARYLDRATEIEQSMIAESARWGDYSRDIYPTGNIQDLYTLDDHWIPERDWMLDTYFPQRCAVALTQLRNAGLYPALDAPEFDQHGGRHPIGTAISLVNPSGLGAIYTTTDGSDPRLPGGAISPTATLWTGSALPLSAATTLQARVLDGATWSALLSADFTVDQPFGDLLINELNYNSANISEFVELHNRGPVPIDLTGTTMGNGVYFTFPAGTILPPEGFLVLSEDADDFMIDWGQMPDGVYDGKLSNKGERVSVEDGDGTVLVTVDYDDAPPWPIEPDGTGPSLELITPELDPSDPLNWQASWVIHGTPWLENSCEPFSWIEDFDADGFGDDATQVSACIAPPGSIPAASGGDCDDTDGLTFPGALDVCDGIDRDCDGFIEVPTEYFADADTDGFGDATDAIEDCSPLPGRVTDDTDCDDASTSTYPGAPELCDGQDNDCDGTGDTFLTSWIDQDSDGQGDAAIQVTDCVIPSGYADNPDDCDDSDATVFLGAPELCDQADNDCDGQQDEGVPTTPWYIDADSDGFGSPVTVDACAQPPGTAAIGGDCNDGDASFHPGASEFCDGADTNCDGQIDNQPVDGVMSYTDADGDGFGDPHAVQLACTQAPGTVTNALDCDDDEPLAWTDADEVCDGVDNDCDGTADGALALDGTVWFSDLDLDGSGTSAESVVACEAPVGFAATDDDCDDADPSTHPGAPEQCDAIDHDCDGTPDNDVIERPWYRDADGDSYGVSSDAVVDCTAPAGYVFLDGDCDDTNPMVSPGGIEVCDGLDNDCNGSLDDDAVGSQTFYEDSDGDGFGATAVNLCQMVPGFVLVHGDCDDTDSAVSPVGVEICDGRDDDCSGAVDDNAVDAQLAFRDLDGDGYGDPFTFDGHCALPVGWTTDDSDCDDTEPLAWTIESLEVCGDGVDNDCDGLLDDEDPDIEPTSAMLWFIDEDDDGFGASTTPVTACAQPAGYAGSDDDCVDIDATVYPGAPEVFDDGVDQDCDGSDALTPPEAGHTADTGPVDGPSPPGPVEQEGCGCQSVPSRSGRSWLGVLMRR